MNAHSSPSRRRGGVLEIDRGFSIIEALLSFVFTIIAILATLAITPISFTHTQSDAIQIQAVAAGQQYMDALRNYIQQHGSDANLPAPRPVAIDSGGVLAGTGGPAASMGNFDIDQAACPQKNGSLFLYTCTVTVRWQQPAGTDRSISIQSYATLQS